MARRDRASSPIRPESPVGLARAVVCAKGILPARLVEGFGPPKLVHHYPVTVRGVPCQELWWIEYSADSKPTAAKPSTSRLDRAPEFSSTIKGKLYPFWF